MHWAAGERRGTQLPYKYHPAGCSAVQLSLAEGEPGKSGRLEVTINGTTGTVRFSCHVSNQLCYFLALCPGCSRLVHALCASGCFQMHLSSGCASSAAAKVPTVPDPATPCLLPSQVVPLTVPFFIRSAWLWYNWTAPVLDPNAIATVACQQLGLGSPGRAVLDTSFGVGNGPIYFAWMACTGTEVGIEYCSYEFNLPVGDTLYHGLDLGIVCGS